LKIRRDAQQCIASKYQGFCNLIFEMKKDDSRKKTIIV